MKLQMIVLGLVDEMYALPALQQIKKLKTKKRIKYGK